MSTTSTSNGWRWVGTAILVVILLLLWLLRLGPSQSGCCGIATEQKQPVPPIAVALSPVNIAFKNNGGKIILSGELPTEATKHEAINAATALFGADKVVDTLTVWKDSSLPSWWQNLGNVLAWVKSGVDFGIRQQDLKITLTGTVNDSVELSAKEADINALLGSGHAVDSQLFASHAAPPPVPEQTPAVSVTPPPVPETKADPEPKNEPEQTTEQAEIPACSKDMNVAISFNLNSATLSAEGKKQLDQIIPCLTTPTQVAGHTDNTGESSYNKMLSKARAKTVIDYINTVNPEKGKLLKSIGYGENKPIAENATRAGRAKNRRIEFMAK